MARVSAFVAASALMGRSCALLEPSSMVTSVLSTFEQYCFPTSNAPLLSSGVWPSVTMIYSGITLTTTPTLLTMTATVPAATASAGRETGSQGGQSVAISGVQSLASATSQVTLLPSVSEPLAVSSGFFGDQNGLPTDSSMISATYSTSIAGSNLAMTSEAATVDPAKESGGVIPPVITSATGAGSDRTNEAERSAFSGGSLSQSTAAASGVNSEGASPFATSSSGLPVQTDNDSKSLPTQSFTGSAGAVSTSRNADGSSVAMSTALPATTSGLPAQLAQGDNQTQELSPTALDALSLAQFLKHLGVSLFNASKVETVSGVKGGAAATAFTALVANISLVCCS